MSLYHDERMITLSADSSDEQYNTTYLSNVLYYFTGLLSDDPDIQYCNISIMNAQIPISYYIINESNYNLRYQLGANPITVVTFDVGNFNAYTFIQQWTTKIPNIAITLNKVNGKYSFSASNNFTFFSSGSTILKLLGFNPLADQVSVANSLTASYPCDFSGIKRLKIISNNLNTYNLDSRINNFSNILATISVNSSANGIILYENINNYKPILRQREINLIDIQIKDDNDNYVNFNNISWNITLQLTIVKKYLELDRKFPDLSNYIPFDEPQQDEQQQDEQQQEEPQYENVLEPQEFDENTDLDFLLYQQGIYL